MNVSSTTTAPAAPGPIQAASLDMARSVLMGLGTPLLAHGYFTGSQWQQVVGGGIAVASAAWSYVAAHPSKVSPIQAVQSLVRAGGGETAWNGDVTSLEKAVLPIVERAVDAQIKARAGLLARPVDALADKAIRSGADTAANHLEIT